MLQNQVIAGRYRLDSQIGAGGSSRVYSATDLRLDRAVAVKVLDARAVSSADPEAVRRFQREAQSLAGFSHPNVVQVFDAGTNADGDPYIVLELVEGQSLATMLHEHGPLALGEATRITQALLAALGTAHAAGLVHRDVKPSNVLFDHEGTAKLADFGIARRFDQMEESLTATGMVVGTPRYLAPEQAAGQALTPATDVYAAGLILQEMLVGPRRAAEETRPAVIDLQAIRPDVGPAYQAVIRQAMNPDPARRFQTTAAMARALEHAATSPADIATTVAAATEVAPVGIQPTELYLPSRRRGASLWWLLVTVLAVATIVGIALAATGKDPTEDALPESTATAAVPVTAAAPPTTLAPTTPPPTTTTLAPTTAPPADLAGAADLPEFLELLTRDPKVAGRHGEELRKSLDKILGSVKSAKTGDRLAELADQVQKWKSDGSLDEAIADSVLRLIDRFEDQQ